MKFPERYGSVSYGVEPNERGSLLLVKDVAQYIDHILDDDETIATKLHEFLDYLRSSGL